jgi:hypothetical protein
VPLLNSILIVIAGVKILSYLRSYEKFGIMVQLIKVCIANMVYFLGFMILWIFIFSQINILIGADFTSDFDSQNELPYAIRVFVQTWKNSFGDSGSPLYE